MKNEKNYVRFCITKIWQGKSNFEAFCYVISKSIKLLFLKSVVVQKLLKFGKQIADYYA